MRGGDHHIEVIVERIARRFAGNQARDMRHVRDRVSADFFGDGFHFGVVQFARISGEAGENHPRFFALCHRAHFVVVDGAGARVFHFVPHEIKNARDVSHRMTVG